MIRKAVNYFLQEFPVSDLQRFSPTFRGWFYPRQDIEQFILNGFGEEECIRRGINETQEADDFARNGVAGVRKVAITPRYPVENDNTNVLREYWSQPYRSVWDTPDVIYLYGRQLHILPDADNWLKSAGPATEDDVFTYIAHGTG